MTRVVGTVSHLDIVTLNTIKVTIQPFDAQLFNVWTARSDCGEHDEAGASLFRTGRSNDRSEKCMQPVRIKKSLHNPPQSFPGDPEMLSLWGSLHGAVLCNIET
eukprot:760593-Hanusia_phi.AAC.15